VTKVVDGLVRTYPSPVILREKADQLEAARKDWQARWMVKVMHGVADDMESGGEHWQHIGSAEIGPARKRALNC
jgi:hypothetical protein